MADSRVDEARQFLLWAAGLFALGLLLRFHQIGELEFWLDEALTGYLAYSDDWLRRVHNSPPLYFLITRAWSGLFGHDEAALRAFSALCSGLLIPLAMYTGRSIFSRDAGIAAGIVVLFSPVSIYYAQEARPYALLVTELTFIYWMLWYTSFKRSRAAWGLLLGGTTTAIYTHNLAIIPVALGYLLAVVYTWQLKDWKRCRLYLVTGGASVCLYAPWFLWWLNTTEFHPQDMQWLTQVWDAYTTWRLPVDSVFTFYHAATSTGASVVGKQFFGEPVLSGMSAFGIAGLLALCCLTGYAAFLNKKARPGALALSLLLILPLLTLFVISFWNPVYLRGRYDLIAYPPFILLAGFALAWLKNQISAGHSAPLAYLLCAVFLIPPGLRTAQFYGAGNIHNAEATARYLSEQLDEEDLVLMEENRGIRTIYYLQLISYTWDNGKCKDPARERAFTCRFLPVSMESAPAAITRHWRAVQSGNLARDAAGIVQKQAYKDIYLLVKRLDMTQERVTINKSIAPVLAELQGRGYTIEEIRPDLNLLRLRSG